MSYLRDGLEFMLSFIKPAEDEQGYVLRGYYLGGLPLEATAKVMPEAS